MEEEEEDLTEEEEDIDVLDADVTGVDMEDSVDMEDTEDMVDMVDTTLEIIWIWILPKTPMLLLESSIILN